MKKTIVLFACFIGSVANIMAEEINALVLHLASGNKVTCMLSEQPFVTFKSDELVITTFSNVVSYKSSDVNKFTYTFYDPTDIKSAQTAGAVFSIVGNSLHASSLQPSSKVTVYTVDGKLIASDEADKKGEASVNLPEQPNAVYVIQTSVANFKIHKP